MSNNYGADVENTIPKTAGQLFLMMVKPYKFKTTLFFFLTLEYCADQLSCCLIFIICVYVNDMMVFLHETS